MKKNPKVKIINSDGGYKLHVAVYRHTVNPKEITVHIMKVFPVLPEPPTHEDEVARVVDREAVFEAKEYPPKGEF